MVVFLATVRSPGDGRNTSVSTGLETFFIAGRRSPAPGERQEGEGQETGPPANQERRDSSSSLLHKKACSLPSIIEPSDASKQVSRTGQG